MKKQNKIALLLILMFLIASCASVPLTSDQSARAAISKAQGQWIVWFDAAQGYYKMHPEKQHEWKGVVIPAFQSAKDNLVLASSSLQKGMDTEGVIHLVNEVLFNLTVTLTEMGVLK